MNFLNGGTLSAFGRFKFWPKTCCRDVLKSKPCISLVDTHKKIAINRTKSIGGTSICKGNLCLSAGPTLWTQVRYQKHFPRFHRDLDFPNFDPYRKDEFKDVRKTSWGSGEHKPGVVYVVGFFGFLAGMYAAKGAVYSLVSVMAPPADVLAMASIEVDISKVVPGGCLTVKWRGKPLFFKSRTATEIDVESKTALSELKDPETADARAPKPEWLVVIGICTHLGCVPVPNSGDYTGGFYCPCHGSHYDNLGRIRKGPAPLNLVIPPYKFTSDSVILVG